MLKIGVSGFASGGTGYVFLRKAREKKRETAVHGITGAGVEMQKSACRQYQWEQQRWKGKRMRFEELNLSAPLLEAVAQLDFT